jgi:hypothetical protein
LNDGPIDTDQDGPLNCIGLMDAASCFILATELVAAEQQELSQLQVRRLFKKAAAHKNALPTKLFIPVGQFPTVLPTEARRQGVSVVAVEDTLLLVFIGEAQDSFREHMQGGRSQ